MTASPARAAPPARGPVHPLVAAAFAALSFVLDAALLALALGGPRALLAHPRALALLGVYGATGIPLALLRPIRGQDTVTRSPDPAWRLVLLVLVPLVIPPVSAFGERAGLAALPPLEWLGWLGVALAAAGLLLRIAAMRTLGPRFAPIVALQREHALETRGPYAQVRHPGYLGAWIAALGAILTFRNGLAMPLLVLFSWLLAERARGEDAVLEAHFGEPYRAWARRTGAFLPRPGGARARERG